MNKKRCFPTLDMATTRTMDDSNTATTTATSERDTNQAQRDLATSTATTSTVDMCLTAMPSLPHITQKAT